MSQGNSSHPESLLRRLQTFARPAIAWIRSSTLLAFLFALAGGLAYAIQSWIDIRIQTSFIDEGGYLYLGYLYLQGLLRPFQDFGPRSIYAPLSSLIPGIAEEFFGPSLLTGRLFSLFLALLTLAGLWLVTRRLAGKWWAAAAVWAIALTPTQIMVFSAAISEVLVACLLTWMLVFVLGEKRRLDQIVLGSILAGLIVMTRQNMLPVIPLLVGYVFWQHGKKAGWWCLAASLAPILVLHAIYWPNILVLWARWLPSSLTPFLDRFRPGVPPTWAGTSVPLTADLLYFFQGILFNYFAFLGALVPLVLWPGRKGWSNSFQKRASVFLAVLFWTLYAIHAAVTLVDHSNDPCVSCLPPYLSFFSVVGILLACLSFPAWKRALQRPAGILLGLATLPLAAGLGFASYDLFGGWVLQIHLPAVQRGWDPHSWFPGFTPAEFLANKYGWNMWAIRGPAATLAGLAGGLLLVVAIWLVHRVLVRKRIAGNASFAYVLLASILVAGTVLSPLARGDYREEGTCNTNIPQDYQRLGVQLASLIPAGSQVFWEAQNTVPLLYAPGINIFPAQVYGRSSYRNGTDSQTLLRLGYWNDAVEAAWREEADFIVYQPHPYEGSDNPPLAIDFNRYTESRLPPLNPCRPNSYLLVYQKIQK